MHFVRRIGLAVAAGLVVGFSVGAIDAMAQTPSPTPPAKAAKTVHKTAATRSAKTATPKTVAKSPTRHAAATAPRSLTHETTHQMKGVSEKMPGVTIKPAANESNASNPSQPRIPGVN